MTTRALEELDRGLGSCLASEDLSAGAEPCPGDKSPAETPRLRNSSSWPQDSQEPAIVGNVATKPKRMEKEPVARASPGAGKEKLKSGATPRSALARKKAQAMPPLQPPPPPPTLSEDLPWGELSLNKCVVLAALVALLGSACQLCREALDGEGTIPTLAPELWVAPSSSPKEPVSLSLPKPPVWAPPLGPPIPQVGSPAPHGKTEDRPEVPITKEAAEKAPGEPKEDTREDAGEEHVPLQDGRPKERPRRERLPKEERPQKKPRKEDRRRKERPRKERPLAAGEAREAREAGSRRWVRDSKESEHRKLQAWVPRRRPTNNEDQRAGPQKPSAGKGRG